MKLIVMVMSCLFLSSCAIVSKKDCATFDWSSKAQQDIQANKDWQKYLEKYNKICTKHGFSISESYMNGVHSKGGKVCTKYKDFPEKGFKGLGARDAFLPSPPDPSKYDFLCAKYNITINLDAYNKGVKSVGGRACSNYTDFDEKGWAGVGRRDAKGGNVLSVESYVKVCKENYFTDVNTNELLSGYKKGLSLFCKKKSGYEHALKGGVYLKTCTRNEKSFLSGFKIGTDVRTANLLEKDYKSALSRVDSITAEIDNNHSQIESLNEDIGQALRKYKRDKEDLEDDVESLRSDLGRESDPSRQEEVSRKLTDLREELVELEEKTLSKERENKRDIENARFSISRLREERRQLDRTIPSLEMEYRAARIKADTGLKRL